MSKTTSAKQKLRPTEIVLEGARHNNLKNFSVRFPLGKWTIITGLSGSGKSTLAFDTLYAEGQRRYIESLSTYTRQFLEKMPKPEVQSILNLPPAIALEQRNSVMNSRSTVGTQTETVDALRIIFARIGTQYCSVCGGEVRKIDSAWLLEEAMKWFQGKKGAILAPLVPPKSPDSKKKSKKAEKPLGVDGLFATLKARGLRRVLWKKGNKEFLPLDLDTWGTPEFPRVPETSYRGGELFAVVDRLKMSKVESSTAEERSRVHDSLEQAIDLGHGAVEFWDLEESWGRSFQVKNCCVNCAHEAPVPEPNLFSFNSPMGACPVCSGFGFTLDLDEALIVPDPRKTLKNGAIDPFSKPSFLAWERELLKFCQYREIPIGKRFADLTPKQKELIWKGGDDPDEDFPGIVGFFKKLAEKKYKLHVRVFIRRYQTQNLCQSCNGARLNPDALAVKFGDLSIVQALNQSVDEGIAWLDSIALTKGKLEISREALTQFARRLRALHEVGVGYLSLSRLTKTLSGGEFQRIHLASQLGSGLCGTLYVLDEPSIGLHAADTERLIGVLSELRDQGNTLVVVEHDLDVLRAADWIIELGPGAGKRGGELVAMGDPKTVSKTQGSLTANYLSGAAHLEPIRKIRDSWTRSIRITGCRENNLKNIDLTLPLERLVVVTGVSGSGKSTLIHHTLNAALEKFFATQKGEVYGKPIGRFDRMYGAEQIGGVVLLDQSPIGKNSRSNPATYLKAWDDIRKLYSNQPNAIRRGLSPQHFSFNVDGGRCPICKGEGEVTIDLHFMAEVKLPCEECEGKRFKRSVLEIRYRGKNVHELLTSTIDEAHELFRDHLNLARKLRILREVGLGYLELGQSGAVLSGGESQRLKIAAALEARSTSRMLYIFDEPTTGLHLEDIRRLLRVFQDLVDAHHSVLLIEHHLDVIAQCDWVIDLGPGGGTQGGQIVAEGPPLTLHKFNDSQTGRMLASHGFLPNETMTLSP